MTDPALPPTSTSIAFQGNSFVDSRPRTELLTGRATFVLVRDLDTSVAPLDLVPDDYVLRYGADEGACHDHWYEGPRGGFLLEAHPFGVRLSITGTCEATVAEVFSEVEARAAQPDRSRRVRIWHASDDGPRMEPRRLEALSWSSIASNYPGAARAQLDRLMTSGPPTGTGRLLLWHGEPGTGKTSATLALLDAWYDWCTPHVISDPERMFTDANYLLHIVSQAVTTEGSGIDLSKRREPRWKLIICEDADEYLRSDARARSGPALGRLLNATDGLIGRGTRSLVLLTTNDEVGRLHPAVTRPGRCLSLIDFPRFSVEEASLWLGSRAPSHGATLAELFEYQESGLPDAVPERIGAYL